MEMILTMALLILAMGMIVISASHWLDREREEDVAYRLEALMSQLRAESALSGQRIRLYLPASTDLDAQLMIESKDPDAETNYVKFDKGLAPSLMDFSTLRFLQVSRLEDKSWDSEMDPMTRDNDDLFPAITFYPDGSQDSVEIDWVFKQNPQRAARLTLDGMSGRTESIFITAAQYEEETGLSLDITEFE